MLETEINTQVNGFIPESPKLYLVKLLTDNKYKNLISLHKYLNLKKPFSKFLTTTNDLHKILF